MGESRYSSVDVRFEPHWFLHRNSVHGDLETLRSDWSANLRLHDTKWVFFSISLSFLCPNGGKCPCEFFSWYLWKHFRFSVCCRDMIISLTHYPLFWTWLLWFRWRKAFFFLLLSTVVLGNWRDWQMLRVGVGGVTTTATFQAASSYLYMTSEVLRSTGGSQTPSPSTPASELLFI